MDVAAPEHFGQQVGRSRRPRVARSRRVSTLVAGDDRSPLSLGERAGVRANRKRCFAGHGRSGISGNHWRWLKIPRLELGLLAVPRRGLLVRVRQLQHRRFTKRFAQDLQADRELRVRGEAAG